MSDLQTVLHLVDELDREAFRQLYEYIVARYSQRVDAEDSVPGERRILGLHAHLGEHWMRDDFDTPLPDEFWLGEA